ncbi:hypothetical protein GCM10008171_32390 [Methylopila jiangsuensis]|uniref:Uncharacterized protein n=1 Tax=Methylopila jiangsuensis TaxID=586230 RepID=A0A9W6JI04_9HYPH|nr:hypothetical protein [Methylopila jiangsuensis]MDR6284626.1 hypothetical protein [Methylopila jiangsuensis]GLK77985.1 hypothetical protein GCM10008171_32390 [Methylopila jiangsuensis]
MTESKTLSDLRIRLGGVECDAFGGDNISVFLASEFERHVEGDEPEMDEYDTWPQEAVDKANEVLDAIHAAYTPAIEAQAAEIERLQEALEWALERATDSDHPHYPMRGESWPWVFPYLVPGSPLGGGVGEAGFKTALVAVEAARAALNGDDHE